MNNKPPEYNQENVGGNKPPKKHSYLKIVLPIVLVIVVAGAFYLGYSALTNNVSEDVKYESYQFTPIYPYRNVVVAGLGEENGHLYLIQNGNHPQYPMNVVDMTNITRISFGSINDQLFYFEGMYDKEADTYTYKLASLNIDEDTENVVYNKSFKTDQQVEFNDPLIVNNKIYIPEMDLVNKKINVVAADDSGSSTVQQIDIKEVDKMGETVDPSDQTVVQMASNGSELFMVQRLDNQNYELIRINQDNEVSTTEFRNYPGYVGYLSATQDKLYIGSDPGEYAEFDAVIRAMDLNNPDAEIEDVYTIPSENYKRIKILDNQLYLWNGPDITQPNGNIPMGGDVIISRVDLNNGELEELFTYTINAEDLDYENPNRSLFFDVYDFEVTDEGYYIAFSNFDTDPYPTKKIVCFVPLGTQDVETIITE